MPISFMQRTLFLVLLLFSAFARASDPVDRPVRILPLALPGAKITRPSQARIVRLAEQWLKLVETASGRKLPAEVRFVFRTSERRLGPRDIDRLARHFGQPGSTRADRLLAWEQWRERATHASSDNLWAEAEPFLCAFPLAGYSSLHRPDSYSVLGREEVHERWLTALETPLYSFATTATFVVKDPIGFVVAYPGSPCGVVVLSDIVGWESGAAIVLHELAHWIDAATCDPALLAKGLPLMPTWDESFADVLSMAYLGNPCISEDDTQTASCLRRLDRANNHEPTPVEVTSDKYYDGPSSFRAQLWRRLGSLSFEEVVVDLFALRELVFHYAQAALDERPPAQPTLTVDDHDSTRVEFERVIIQRAWEDHLRRSPIR